MSHEYTRYEYDYCAYFKKLNDGSYIYLTFYVDDILIVVKDKSYISKHKKFLSKEFEIKDIGVVKKILGMEIYKDIKVENYGSPKRIM